MNEPDTLERAGLLTPSRARRLVSAAPSRAVCGLRDDEVRAGIQQLRRTSQQANRDVALLLTMLCTGARPLEIARLRLESYLLADGSVRRQSRFPAAGKAGGDGRAIFFNTKRTDDAIDAYLEERLQCRLGVGTGPGYRGLVPQSALFFTSRGEPFQIRWRGTYDPRPTCPSLLLVFVDIFRQAGWRGVTAQSIRRSFVERVVANGADLQQLDALLGRRTRRPIARTLESGHRSLQDLVKDLV